MASDFSMAGLVSCIAFLRDGRVSGNINDTEIVSRCQRAQESTLHFFKHNSQRFVSEEYCQTRKRVHESIQLALRDACSLCSIAVKLGSEPTTKASIQCFCGIDLSSRCGWILEQLVECSCDVEELRKTVTVDEKIRLAFVDRYDF